MKLSLFKKAFKIEFSVITDVKNMILAESESLSSDDQHNKEKQLDLQRKMERRPLKIVNKTQMIAGSQPKQLAEEVINSKTHVIELVKRMNLVDILRKASLNTHQRILLPLVVLRAKRGKFYGRDSQNVDDQVKNSEAAGHSAPMINTSSAQNHGVNSPSERRQKSRSGKISDYKLIYEIQKTAKPRNSIEGICSDQILKYLSIIFEEV